MDLNLTSDQLEIIDLALFYREQALIKQRDITDSVKRYKELTKDIQENRETSRAIAEIRHLLSED